MFDGRGSKMSQYTKGRKASLIVAYIAMYLIAIIDERTGKIADIPNRRTSVLIIINAWYEWSI